MDENRQDRVTNIEVTLSDIKCIQALCLISENHPDELKAIGNRFGVEPVDFIGLVMKLENAHDILFSE